MIVKSEGRTTEISEVWLVDADDIPSVFGRAQFRNIEVVPSPWSPEDLNRQRAMEALGLFPERNFEYVWRRPL